TLAEGQKIGSEKPIGREDTVRFFSLGRFSPKDKGQPTLLEIFSDSKWTTRDWRLRFVGISAFGHSYIETLVKYFGLDGARVEIVAPTDKVFEEIGNNDILLMPSRAEGTPFAMIESMAAGRPAVGTPVGGIPELIRNGETGWLAGTTDVSDIAEAMERMWQ